ncbi:MAG: tetratricopeptide repeat protein [bacterium]|nr:tetratricopeptide repeat protein [bacterium]
MSTFMVKKSLGKDPFVAGTFNVAGEASNADECASLAAHELEIGDFQEAEKILQQGLEMDPAHAGCLAYMAVCVSALGRDDGTAEQMARTVISRYPEDPAGWFALAQVHLLGGNRSVAFQHFAKARELSRRDPRFRAQVDRQDPRNPNIVRSLPRDHIINVILGRLRALFRSRDTN